MEGWGVAEQASGRRLEEGFLFWMGGEEYNQKRGCGDFYYLVDWIGLGMFGPKGVKWIRFMGFGFGR